MGKRDFLRETKILLLIITGAILFYFPFRCLLAVEAQILTPYVLLLTLIAVIWYSLETHGLRKISAEHLELSFKPHLILICKDSRRFCLYNIGNGPAERVRIDDAVLEVIKGISIRLKFTCPPVLKKDEWLPIGIDLMTADGERKADGFHLAFLTPPTATMAFTVTAHFQNLIGKEYEVPLRIGVGMDEGTSMPL